MILKLFVTDDNAPIERERLQQKENFRSKVLENKKEWDSVLKCRGLVHKRGNSPLELKKRHGGWV